LAASGCRSRPSWCASSGGARSARHWFKDQTRLDPKVRDTWEIPKSRISIDHATGRRRSAALERMRGQLGLPETCRLKAETVAGNDKVQEK
jgi:hypothetical protein